ncbi:MAG: ABC transporter permease, partial [Pseudomonadota bacterium]|nr:ABC transporter permease [Pseudomonadota bacterium]
MIPSIPQSRLLTTAYAAYVVLFFIFLALPLIVVAGFAFNDSQFPSLPWEGFTWNWFFGSERPMIGVFHERSILRAIGTSVFVAFCVSALSMVVGLSNAFLFNRYKFRGQGLLYVFMLLPLVIPGIVLGISILVASSRLANSLWDGFQWDVEALRPGLWLVILGQFSFITTIATLVIGARLQKFDRTLEEAALNLGAGRL